VRSNLQLRTGPFSPEGIELITDQERFLYLQAECKKIIDTRKRLPDFVFRRPFAKYFAIEYAYVGGTEFGAFLFELSNVLKDNAVNFMTLDPDPEDKGYRQHSYFGLASFEPSSIVKDYVPTLHPGGNGSRILAGVNVGVFWGSSQQWAIHCDRISWELAVIAVPEGVDVPKISGFRCRDSAWVSSYMKSQYHWKLSTALGFNEKFSDHYPVLG
jgi:hypothetical protein